MTSANLLIFTSLFVIFNWLRIQFKAENKKNFFQSILIICFWLILILSVGHTGLLAKFDKFPPPFMFFFPSMLLFSFFLAYSKFGTAVVQRVTLANLVFFQSFRILAEIILFLALKEGMAPVQMTFEGYNFDIITGVLAIILGIYLRRRTNKKMAVWFNIMGLAFLGIIAFIAVTSMPTPLRLFMKEPSNIWVVSSPYILLPGVLVVAALTLHLLIFRKLRTQ